MRKTVLIAMPTIARPHLIRKTLLSICHQTYAQHIRFIVIVDGGNRSVLERVDEITLPDRTGHDDKILFNTTRLDWPASMNMVLENEFKEDAFMYAADDIVLEPDCIENAAKMLFTKAPDGDGLVPIAQDVIGCSTAFGLFGRKFAERFPKRHVFCPDYMHYCSDLELGNYARLVGREYKCHSARLIHTRDKDHTFRLAKAVEQRDLNRQQERKHRTWLWGSDFNLLDAKQREHYRA